MSDVRFLASILLALPCTACGCGTLYNMTGQNAPRDADNHVVDKRIYGGVRIDAENSVGIAKAAFLAPPQYDNALQMHFLAVSGMSLWALDLPFSAAADTLTLPATLSASLNKMASRPSGDVVPGSGPSQPAGGAPPDGCSTWRQRGDSIAVR